MTAPIQSNRHEPYPQEPYPLGADDLAALHGNLSTNALLNQARHDVGYHEEVELHGQDESLEETKAEPPLGELVGTAAHGTEIAAELGALGSFVEGGAVAAFAEVGLPILGIAAAVKALDHILGSGEACRVAEERDQSHLAVLDNLDLPKGYAKVESEKHSGMHTEHRAFGKVADAMKAHGGAAVLQLHCDEGMLAAKRMQDAKQPSLDAFLTANPAVKARYDADAAYRNGFDSLVWAKANAPAESDDAVARLSARVAAYAKGHVEVRG